MRGEGMAISLQSSDNLGKNILGHHELLSYNHYVPSTYFSFILFKLLRCVRFLDLFFSPAVSIGAMMTIKNTVLTRKTGAFFLNFLYSVTLQALDFSRLIHLLVFVHILAIFSACLPQILSPMNREKSTTIITGGIDEVNGLKIRQLK